jgi:hypothetical protein
VVDNFLELGGGSTALSGCQVRLSAYIYRIKAGSIVEERDVAQLDWRSSLQSTQGGSRVLSIQRQLCLNRRQPKRLHLAVQREALPQVLCQGFGSRRIASHGKRERGFALHALTRWSQLQSLSH